MMKKMRELAPTIMWIVIVTFIATIFFAWGMNYSASRKNKDYYVGAVGKDKIPLAGFSRKVEEERNKLVAQYNGNAPDEQMKDIPKKLFEEEISRILLKKVFDNMKLSGTADEVYEHLKRNPLPQFVNHPAFQTDSMFDTSKYIAFLNKPESFDIPGMLQLELYVRNYIVPVNKLRSMIEADCYPSRVEGEFEYRRQNEKIVFEYAKVSPKDFYIAPQQITEQMLTKYYETNIDSFKIDKAASVYYVRIDKTPTAEDTNVILNELKDIKERIQSGESTFEYEAKVESDDPTAAKNGGLLGWFPRGRMVPEFEKVAFALQPGEISDPVKSMFGYHLIYVIDKKTENGQEMVKAAHILKKIEPSGETLDSLEDIIDTLRILAEKEGLKNASAKFNGIVVDSTPLFKPGENIPGIGYLPGLGRFAFSEDVKINDISERLENKSAYYLVALKRRVEKGIIPFSDVKEDIRKKLIKKMQIKKAKEYMVSVSKKIGDSVSLAKYGELDSLFTSGLTDTVTRAQYVKNVGYDSKAISVAFAIKEGTKSDIVESDGDLFFVKTLWKNKIDKINYESAAFANVMEQLRDRDQKSVYIAWYVGLKNRFKIEDRLREYYMD